MAQQPDAPAAQPTPPPLLTEDEADDLLYCARTGDVEELQAVLAAAVARVGEKDGKDDAETALRVLAAARDASQNTPLHMAAANGHAGAVDVLLKAAAAAAPPLGQAFVDAANAFGNTALHWAALNGRLAVVRQLVAGPPRCGVALANDKNYIALDLASLQGHGAVAAFFMAEAEARAAGGEAEGETEGETEEKAADGETSKETTETTETAETTGSQATDGLSTATAALALEP